MPYCTTEDVRGMLKDDALNTLIGDEYIEDEAEREAKIVPLIEAAITDADNEINGYLAKRYRLPLQHGLGTIGKLAKDIAVYNLYSRVGIDESSREKNVLNRYEAAIRFLELLAKGEVEIGVSDPGEAARTGFTVSSAPRVFSRNKLKGM